MHHTLFSQQLHPQSGSLSNDHFWLSLSRPGKGIKGVADNAPFGIKYFYKWWVKACANLGIEGVDLYGGTRHSSVRALRKYRSPEEIKRAAMSETNKAFERYMGKDTDDDLRSVYRQSARVIPVNKIDTDLRCQELK